MSWLLPLLSGAVAGIGILLIVRELLPSTPDPGALIARLHGTDITPSITIDRDTARLADRVGATLMPRITVPHIAGLSPTPADLDLVGKAPHTHLGDRALAAGTAFLFTQLIAAVASIGLGITLPLIVTLLGGLAMAAGAWALVDLEVTRKAKEARDDFSRAVAAYLELLAIERVGGAGPTQAIEGAAGVAASWPFQRISQALQRARWDGTPAWSALERLANELDVPALRDAAGIMRLATLQDASVTAQLRGRARSVRGTQLSRERALANEASTRMTIPVALTATILLAVLMLPLSLQML